MPQFDVSTFSAQLLWLFLIFGFLYIVVSQFIAPKAEEILTSRDRYFDDNIKASEDYNDKCQTLKLAKEEKFEELNADSEAIRKNSIEAMEEYFAIKKSDLAESLRSKTQESTEEIKKYIESFYIEESKYCLSLASFIIEKITNKPADLNLLKKIHEAK